MRASPWAHNARAAQAPASGEQDAPLRAKACLAVRAWRPALSGYGAPGAPCPAALRWRRWSRPERCEPLGSEQG